MIVVRPRTESDPATVVIVFRMIERDEQFFVSGSYRREARGVGHVGVASRNLKLRNVGGSVAERAAGDNEVEIKFAVRRVARIEGEAEQTLLGNSGQMRGDIEKSRGV